MQREILDITASFDHEIVDGAPAARFMKQYAELVEDGNLFHVAFEAQPINANCSVDGEGIIEFGVAYHSQGSSGIESVFGVAGWYPASDEDTWIETQGLAYGPIALCTKYTPCRIKEVNIVKTYCPDPYRPFPLYSREDWFH